MTGRRFNHALLPVALVAMLCAGASRAAQDQDIRALFDEANQKFREAVALPAESKPEANALYRDAAARWRAVAESGIDNSRLWLNIANASFLSGDLGRAVAAYRRAELLAPRNQAVIDGLAAARALAGTSPPTLQRSNVSRWIAQSRRALPREMLAFLFFGAWSFAWLFAAARTRVKSLPRWVSTSAFGLAGLAALPFAADAITLSEEGRAAVVVADRVVARNGPSDSVYEPTFQEPLRPGVELDVLEIRADWLRCRLPDGRETWLPYAAVETF